jgi:hypothetical protein
MDWAAMWQAVESAIEAGDKDAEVCALVAIQDRIREGETIPDDVCGSGFATLRKHKRFETLVELGDLCGFDSPSAVVRRHAIQGLIETKQFDRAIRELEKTRAFIDGRLASIDPQGSVAGAELRLDLRHESAEVQGLLGRNYKQRCIDGAKQGRSADARGNDALRSMRYYWEAYRPAPFENAWHGINYVAVARYSRANLNVELPGDEPEVVAERILRDLAYLELRGLLTVWDYATRGEAQLALGQEVAARESYARYLAHPSVDKFMLGSSVRQLAEVWQLPESHELVQLFVRAERGDKPQRRNVDEEQLEARFKDAPYDLPQKDLQAISRGQAVARLGFSDRVGEGTGFLIEGEWIADELKGMPLLLTCAHVCPKDVPAEQLTVMFFGRGKKQRGQMIVEYVELLWTSPPSELDASLLLLDNKPRDVTPAPVATDPIAVGNRAYIISYPFGGAKLASLRNNDICEVPDMPNPRFYYQSATDPGSSGGPVFNDRWELIGIHRAGPESKKLNEGTRLDRVIAELRKHYLPRTARRRAQTDA